MKATTTAGKTIEYKDLSELRAKLIRAMKADKLRGLTATTENGTEVHVEMYDGQDYIRTASGRIIK